VREGFVPAIKRDNKLWIEREHLALVAKAVAEAPGRGGRFPDAA